MDIDFLKTFITVAKYRNISKACDEIHLSQPALSKQIKSLEQLYGFKLFERINKKFLLTEAGRHLLDYAYRIVGLYDESVESISDKGRTVKGTLKIASNQTLGVYILPSLIKPFYNLYPELKIEMFLDNSSNIVKAVKHGHMNFGFIGRQSRDPSILLHPFHQNKLKVVVGTKSGINGKVMSWKELELLPFLQHKNGSDIRTTLEQWLEEKDINLKPTTQLNSTEAIKAFLQCGMGFSILPLCTLEQELKLGLLDVVSVPHFDLTQHYYICYLKNKMFSKPEKLFFKYISNAMESEFLKWIR